MATSTDQTYDPSLRRVLDDLDFLATLSIPGPGVTRLGYTPEDAEARRWFERRCLEIGLRYEVDPFGNAFGWAPGATLQPPVLIGSHLDSVITGGRYDGIVGVVVALEVADLLLKAHPDLPLGVASFACEESTRFGAGCVGSRLLMGELGPEALDQLHDRDGRSLRGLLAAAELGPTTAVVPDRGFCRAFLEVHIDQGTLLSSSPYRIGLVSTIVGVYRFAVTLQGEASHSGGRRRGERRDALLAAAELVLRADELSAGAASPPESLLTTVGKLNVFPNSPNTVPGRVELVLDIRASRHDLAKAYLERLRAAAGEIGTARGVDVTIAPIGSMRPVGMDAGLVEALRRTAADLQIPETAVLSLAGHDAMVLARDFPVAMVLIANPTGLSHQPNESVDHVGLDQAIRLLTATVPRLIEAGD